LLKFVKGDWIIGRDEGKINGASLVAYDLYRQWEKWHDGERVDIMETDPNNATIPIVSDSNEWSLASYLYLRDFNDGNDYTFTTRSNGGTRAVDTLCRQIKNIRLGKPGAYPLVRLDSGKKDYSRLGYGLVDVPIFADVRWVTSAGEPYPTVTPATAQLGRQQVNDLDDEIPF